MMPTESASPLPQARSSAAVPAFHLQRYFSIASGITVLLVTIVITSAYRWSEVYEHVEMAEQRNVMLAQAFANTIWPQFSAHLMRTYGGAREIRDTPDNARLHETLLLMSRNVPVVKIKIYNASGIAVYSSVQQEIGEDKSSNPAFAQARAGEVASELTHRGQMSASEGVIENVDVVSSYIPISPTGRGTEAVFELYTDVTESVANITRMTWRLIAMLCLVFATLYGILLLIVGRADRMLQRQYHELRASEAQIRAKNRDLELEVVERRHVEAALRKSEEDAAAANRAKSEFLSHMSHELRTPMNAILGFAQLLGSEPNAPLTGAQQKFVAEILKAGRHLLELINEVLDLARIEAGRMALSVEPVSLGSALSECLPLVENMAQHKAISIQLPGDRSDVHVMADNVRLKQVLLNLLSNAIKYNRSGGHVMIDAAPAQSGRIRISITDSGIGIAEERRSDLFQPFSRLGSDSAEVEGTGIGLALSRHLITAMGGDIGFTSTLGAGSTFWIDLPLAPDRKTPTLAPTHDALQHALNEAADRSLLYIEDNPANVLLMEQIARRIPVRFLNAHTAELGIELAVVERPDLIVVDINLPGMDGYEALAELRRRPETAAIPIMALSAHAMAKDVSRGLAAGFVRYETKPIQVEKMIATLHAILGHKA